MPDDSAMTVIMEERSGVWWVVTTRDEIDNARRFDLESTARYFFISEKVRISERPIPVREYAKNLLASYKPERVTTPK